MTHRNTGQTLQATIWATAIVTLIFGWIFTRLRLLTVVLVITGTAVAIQEARRRHDS